MNEQDWKRAEEIGKVLGPSKVASAFMDQIGSFIWKLRNIEKGIEMPEKHIDSLTGDLARLSILCAELGAVMELEPPIRRQVDYLLQKGEQLCITKLEQRKRL